MALNINNNIVEEKAVLASKITGKNKTATVGQALDYFLKHHKPIASKSNKEVVRLLDEMSHLPVLDSRSAAEILGYDECGLAR